MKRYFFIVFFIFSLSAWSFEYQVFEENGKQGLKNDDEVLIPAKFEKLGWSEGPPNVHGKVLGFMENNLWGIISLDNEIVSDPAYLSLSTLGSGHYIMASRKVAGAKTRQFGLLDNNGRTVVEFKYVKLLVHNEKIIAWISTDSNLLKAGIIDYKENTIVPFRYRDIKPLGSLRFVAELPDRSKELLNDSGVKIAEFKLDSIASFISGYATFWSGHFQGLMDKEGNVVVKPLYRDIHVGNDGFEVLRYPMWKSIDFKSSESFSLEFDDIKQINDSVFKVRAYNSDWLTNEKGEKITSFVYDSIGDFYDGHAICKRGGKYGVLNTDGKEIIPSSMRNVYINNGFFYVVDIRKDWKILDRFLIQKSKTRYDSIGNYQKLHFPVLKNGFWGLVDLQGEEVLNCVFDSLGLIKDNLIVVKFKGLHGIVNLSGEWVVPPNKYPKEIVNDFLYIEKEGSLSKIYDINQNLIYFTDNKIEAYDHYFLERLTTGNVWKISFSGVIEADKLSNIVYRDKFKYSEFEEIYPESEGLSVIKKDGKYGFIDDQNRLRVANRYDSVQDFHEGYAAIKLIGKWGFIDKSEELVIQPHYENVGFFENGLCLVKIMGKYDLINLQNQQIFRSGFDFMKPSFNNRYVVTLNDQKGLVDSSGKVLVNYVFDELYDLNNGYVLVRKWVRWE